MAHHASLRLGMASCQLCQLTELPDMDKAHACAVVAAAAPVDHACQKLMTTFLVWT